MPTLTESQRAWSAIFVSVLGLFIIVFGAKRVISTIRSPFAVSLLPTISENLSEDERLQRDLGGRDTDGDGLSDYDELYLYNTSPYLADSDSDGIDDQSEVENGGDPNCPGNQDCYGAILESKSVGQSFTGQFAPETSVNSDMSSLKGILPDNPSPDDVRALLREGGVAEEDINKLSDGELIELYHNTLNAVSE